MRLQRATVTIETTCDITTCGYLIHLLYVVRVFNMITMCCARILYVYYVLGAYVIYLLCAVRVSNICTMCCAHI